MKNILICLTVFTFISEKLPEEILTLTGNNCKIKINENYNMYFKHKTTGEIIRGIK